MDSKRGEGRAIFAAVYLSIGGVLNIIWGIAAIGNARFFVHDLAQTTQYLPDFEALRASASRLVIGLGAESGHLMTHRTSIAVAERLGVKTTEFPGDHGGFMGAPGEFADRLREVLAP